MKKDYTNSFLLNTLGIPIVTDLNSLSNTLAISTKLIYLLSQKTSDYYKVFYIKKKNGKLREILSPSYSLRIVQKWILNEILEKISISDEAMAYRKGKNAGIKKNAELHKFNLYILEMDIKDFFKSIKRNQIFFLFKNLGYSRFISNILSKICTYQGYLPQGGICSPYISNLVCYKLDKRIKNLCAKRDVTYSRYCDDLTFSCDNKDTLKKLNKVITDIVLDEGFLINESKTRYLSPYSHKKVTGITVNDNRVKASKQLKRTVRWMIHQAIVSKDYTNINKIRGYISFISSIEDGYKDKILKYINKLVEKDYKYFTDIVEAYNKNKILKEANSMTFTKEYDFFQEEDFPENNDLRNMNKLYYEEICSIQYEFLEQRGYIKQKEMNNLSEEHK